MLQQSCQLDEAISLAREALAQIRWEFGDDSPFVAQALVQVGQIARARGDMVEAETAMLEAVEIYSGTLGESDVSTALATLHLATVLDDSGESERAAELFPQAIEALRARYGGDHWQVANARNRYGLCLLRLGRLEQAERELLAA